MEEDRIGNNNNCPITSINIGDNFLCIEDVEMHYSEVISYIKGEIYKSEENGCITDIQGDIYHGWDVTGNENVNQFFIKC